MVKLKWITISDPHSAPTLPGVYQYWQNKKLLYIGKAVSLRARLLSHLANAKLDPKERAIVTGATHLRYTLTDNEFFALLLEAKLIKTYQPPYNFASRDDKSYLYIVIDTRDNYPKPRLVRGTDLPDHKIRGIKTFGPFPSTALADNLLRSIRRLIPFCQAKRLGKRACFYAHVGLCSPCPNTITLDLPATRQYRQQIFQVIKILEGQTAPVIANLRLKMTKFSDQHRYEEALEIRNKIESFQRFIDTHSFSNKRLLVINESDQKLQSLQNLLQSYLPDLESLSRIECYDASNLLNQFSTVSLVVMTDGRLDKSQYRRFKINNPRANSDFSRLQEALVRRFNNAWPRPDLLVIDGGKPQVRMALRVLDTLDNPPFLIGLAKAPDRLIIPQTRLRTTLITVEPQPSHPGFNLLKLLRDESHRFANNYRKILEKKNKFGAPGGTSSNNVRD